MTAGTRINNPPGAQEDSVAYNLNELEELIECCNGPSLETCCFDCPAHHICKIETKCGGEVTKDFHGNCEYANDSGCPHQPDYQLPPRAGIKINLN